MNSLIDSLNAWGAKLFELAPTMLWQSSLLIAIVLAVDLALRRKLRASIRYALWLVVLVKLILPPTLALPTGAAWWLRTRPILAPRPHVMQTLAITYGNSIAPEPQPAPTVQASAPPPPHLTTSGWLLLTSACGSAILLTWLLMRWIQTVRLVRRASNAPKAISDIVEAINLAGRSAAFMPLQGDNACDSRTLKRNKFRALMSQVRLTKEQISPAVCGLFRPVILLPESLVDKLGPDQLRAVLLHEFIHLKRQDIWVNFAQSLLQITYWWHPLLWFANARIRRVREEAVDDAVMVTLREDSEVYAPTLLEVAKFAFNRPLASLGMVGILESKNALRQRIERLLNTTPRRAGLSIVSIFGIVAFTALAVPMAEGPARVIDAGGSLDSANSINLMPFHAKVNPEVFIRNLKTRAGETMHTTNDSLNDILLSVVDGYGIDCTPPRAIAFDSRTGEVTAQNTPEALQRLDEIIKELNLPGGEHIINPPYGVKQVSITAHIYQMRSADFARLNLDDTKSQKQPNASPSWDLTSNQVDEVMQKINDLGIQTMSSPQARTFHGCTAEFSITDLTNNSRIDFQCRPSIGDGTVFLSVLARTTGEYAPDGHGWPDFAGWTNCAIFTRVGVPDGGGVLLESGHPGYMPENKLVVLLHVKIIEPTGTASRPTSVHRAGSTPQQSESIDQLLQEAKTFTDHFRFNEANKKLDEVLQMDPENPDVHEYKLRIEKAWQSAKTVLLELDESEGERLFKEGELNDAKTQFPQILKARPEDSKALYYLNLIQQSEDANRTNSSPIVPKNLPNVPDHKTILLSANGARSAVPIQAAKDSVDASLPQVNIKGRFVEVDAVRDASGHLRAVDSDFTAALKNILTNNTEFPSNPPDFMMGTLSENQMKTVLEALQHSKKAALLDEGQVTTCTERQAMVFIGEQDPVLNGVTLVASNRQSHYDYTTTNMSFGENFDVTPRVSTDGASIAFTFIPRVTAFLGYENPRAFLKEHKEFSQYNHPGASWPIPKVRIREAIAKATVADGETLLLANLNDDTVTKLPDGSNLKQKYSSKAPYEELLVFATVTLVDKSGNRVHPDNRVSETAAIVNPSGNPIHSKDYYDTPVF